MPDSIKKKIIKSLGEIAPHIEQMEEQAFDAMIQCIRDNMSPEDVFTTKQLGKWAEANGYVQDLSEMEW
jgi:hypothetical protein